MTFKSNMIRSHHDLHASVSLVMTVLRYRFSVELVHNLIDL